MTRHVTFMTIDDAEHYTPQQRAEIISAYPAHEREARARAFRCWVPAASFRWRRS